LCDETDVPNWLCVDVVANNGSKPKYITGFEFEEDGYEVEKACLSCKDYGELKEEGCDLET